MVWTTAPVEASSSVTVLSPAFATQTWVPSEEMPAGPPPTPMVWTTAPVEASSSVTVPPPSFETQTWVPSEETPTGPLPTPMVLDDRRRRGRQRIDEHRPDSDAPQQ